MHKQRRNARFGLIAVALVLMGCLGVLMAPKATKSDNSADLQTESQRTDAVTSVNPKL